MRKPFRPSDRASDALSIGVKILRFFLCFRVVSLQDRSSRGHFRPDSTGDTKNDTREHKDGSDLEGESQVVGKRRELPTFRPNFHLFSCTIRRERTW